MAATSPLVSVRGLRKQFGPLTVLDDISFDVRRGEALGIIGPSGGGKSTLLRCIDLLVPIDEGSIRYHFRRDLIASPDYGSVKIEVAEDSAQIVRIEEVRSAIGFVFQGLYLWQDRSVLDNLTLAPRVVLRLGRDDAEHRAVSLAEKLGLKDKLHARVWQLSGGQRQRVAIARMLMMSPALLLLDEITSALDPVLVADVMAMVQGLRDDGTTMVLVTHQIEFASRLCDRLAFLHEGRLVQIGTPADLLNNPANGVVERFISTVRAAR